MHFVMKENVSFANRKGIKPRTTRGKRRIVEHLLRNQSSKPRRILNRQQLTCGLPVGKEEKCLNFVDSTLISLIKAKIEHSLDVLICTYPENKEETLLVPCKCSLGFLMDFHLEIYGKCMFVNLTSLMMDIFPLAHREGKGCTLLIQELAFFIEKHKTVFVKRALKELQLLLRFQVLKDNKPLTLQVYYDAPRPKKCFSWD
jgi:hypothetical protein